MTLPYPIPKELRQSDIFVGDGGAAYGPFSFKIFDIGDVEVWTMPAGALGFAKVSATVAKVSNAPLEYFTVNFLAGQPVTTKIVVLSVRLDNRSAGVINGTRIDPTALEKELSKIATIEQELRRDINRAVLMEFGADPLRVVAGIPDGSSLKKVGGQIVAGPDVAQGDAALAASVAAEAEARALADFNEAQTRALADIIEATTRSQTDAALASLIGQAGQIETAIYDSRLAASMARTKPGIRSIFVGGCNRAGDGGAAVYRFSEVRPAHDLVYQDANGNWFEIAERVIYVEMAGYDTSATADAYANAAAAQRCIDYVYGLGGGAVIFPPGVTACGPIQPKDGVYLIGRGMNGTSLLLPDGANADFIKSVGFDEFADGVKRSYNYYLSNAARNAAGVAGGTYSMVSPSRVDFKSASWSKAINTPASTDADWVACGPVVGMVGGGVKNMTLLGNRQNQVGDFWGLALYGVGLEVDGVEVRAAAKAIQFEAPGAIIAPIGKTIQWHIGRISARDYTKQGIYNNAQSDGVVVDVMSAGDDGSVIDYLLRFGLKATGQKWFGGHIWGGAQGTMGVIFEGGTNTLFDVEVERPTLIKATAGGTGIIGGKSYRINDASRENGPAIILEEGINSLTIAIGVTHFRYPIKFMSPVGIANDIDLKFYSEDPLAADLDPSGVTALTSLALSRNFIKIRPSFTAVLARFDVPRVRTSKVTLRPTAVAGNAGVISPDLNVGSLYRCLGISTGLTVNNPANGVDGEELEFYFGQDATGGRAIAWGANYRGAPAAVGASNQYCIFRFRFNGVFWVYSGGSGAWV